MRAHVIDNAVVVNTIEVESLDFLPGLVSADHGGTIGDRYEAGQFIAPVATATVPRSVTMRQGRLALLGAGLLDQVDATLAATADDAQRRAAQIEWEYAQVIERDSDWVSRLSAALSLSREQVDALFIQAAAL